MLSDHSDECECTLSEGDWEELVIASDAAGRLAARELALRYNADELARQGTVKVSVGPAASPLVAWLVCTGRAARAPDDTAEFTVELTEADIQPSASPNRKARSLLVRQAYAAAFCTTLTEEAGALAESRTVSSPATTPRIPQPRTGLSEHGTRSSAPDNWVAGTGR